jgi:hypothetical protein
LAIVLLVRNAFHSLLTALNQPQSTSAVLAFPLKNQQKFALAALVSQMLWLFRVRNTRVIQQNLRGDIAVNNRQHWLSEGKMISQISTLANMVYKGYMQCCIRQCNR